MEYTHIEHHKEGQLNHRLPQTKLTTLSEGMQENAYISLVRSVLEYGATIWDPYQKNDIEKLEKIQEEELDLLIKTIDQEKKDV